MARKRNTGLSSGDRIAVILAVAAIAMTVVGLIFDGYIYIKVP